MSERAEEREAQLAKFRGAAPGLSERLASERPDAIPAEAIEAAAQALCAWPSVKVDDREHNTATHMATAALAAAAPFLRAAHPEAGNEDEDWKPCDNCQPEIERLQRELLGMAAVAQREQSKRYDMDAYVAQPEAGSEEGERQIEAAARVEYERGIAEPYTPGHGSLPAFDEVPDDRKAAQALGPYGDASWNRKRSARREARWWAETLRAAHPEADRAPEDKR